MIKRDWDVLFYKYDLRQVLQHQLESVAERVRGIPDGRFDSTSDDFLAAEVASELVVSPLEILEDKITVSSSEAQIDVSHDRDRHFFEPGPHYVAGLEVTYHLPYVGDKELLECRPNTSTLNPPRAVIDAGELRFPYDEANRNVAATKQAFHADLATLKQWLPWVNAQVDEYNSSIEAEVRQSVAARRSELDRTQQDLADLGYPLKESHQVVGADESGDPVERRAAKRTAMEREYDVALSFAGEDRDYVDRVAAHLVDLGVTVFYDRYETVNLWGKDLADHLGKVYSHNSHFVVMFASRHYAEKAWPSHERQFALSRNLKGDRERILPVRIDDTEIPGLSPTIGYLDARVVAAERLAELIRQKLDAA